MKADRNIESEENVRMRIIDVLLTFSSEQEQIKYQKNVHHVYIPVELINQWGDWVNQDRKDWYRDDVYSHDELKAIWKFDAVLDKQADLIDSSLKIEQIILTDPWKKMMEAAREALLAFKTDREQ